MPDGSNVEGLVETSCKKLKPSEIVQFERFGFVRIEKINLKLIAYFSHK